MVFRVLIQVQQHYIIIIDQYLIQDRICCAVKYSAPYNAFFQARLLDKKNIFVKMPLKDFTFIMSFYRPQSIVKIVQLGINENEFTANCS